MKKIFTLITALTLSAGLWAKDVTCTNLYRYIYTDNATGDPYYSVQFGDEDWNSYYFGFKDATGPLPGRTYTMDDMIAEQTYASVNYEQDMVTAVSFQRNYEGLQEQFTASVTTQSGAQYNLTWAAADIPAKVDDVDLDTTIVCNFADYGFYKTFTPLVRDDNNYDFTIAIADDLPAVGAQMNYTWKANTIYIGNANFQLPNDWNTKPFDATFYIKGVEGGYEGIAKYSMTNGKKYTFNFSYTVPAPAPYLFVDGIVTINELKEGETIYFQYFNYDNGKRVNGIGGDTNRNKSFEPYDTEGYCEIHYTNKDNVERNFIVNPKIENAVDSIYQGETYLFADTLLTTAGTYQRTIESNTMTLTLKVKQKVPKYTEYENWQIKYGGAWEWSGNMEKVDDGLFKLEIRWEGTGINVKSDENPINKDWFALEELTIGEGVIAPATVDVYLRVIDDKTLKIGVGVEPPVGPTVDKTGITVNGRKYGFPVRLVKEVK